MYNAASKLILAALTAGIFASCGNADRDAATQLCQAAGGEVKSGNYDAAIMMLDTLDSKYATQIEVRKSAMKFRAMAVEGLTLKRISSVDDTLATLKADIERMQSDFDYVANPGNGLGGNYIAKSLGKKSYDILPRINDDGYFTLSVKIGRSIGFEYVTFYDASQSVSTQPVASTRLVKVENSEMTVLQQEDVKQAIDWLCANGSVDRYDLVGSKSSIKQKLTPQLRDAIIETWKFAGAKQSYRLALIEREKLERKLQLCRDQLANVIDR